MSGHPSGTLHTVCQVECIRCNDLPDAMTDLLDSAMQIISAVMDFVKYCDQEDSIRQQYTWIVSPCNLSLIQLQMPNLSGSTFLFYTLQQQVLLQLHPIAVQCLACHYLVPSRGRIYP